MLENKDFVINVCKNVLKTASEHLGGMLVLKQADMTDLATMKGTFDACSVMIENISENRQPSAREKELFDEKNLCHSFLIQENMMTAFQDFKKRKKGAK